jgi:hypothetical protein
LGLYKSWTLITELFTGVHPQVAISLKLYLTHTFN